MAPAGEMWSVVTLSPKMPMARAPADVRDRSSGHAEVLEERGLLDVGALAVPLVDLAHAGGDFIPLGILVCEAGVEFLEDFTA
jgi:hypothetical protein